MIFMKFIFWNLSEIFWEFFFLLHQIFSFVTKGILSSTESLLKSAIFDTFLKNIFAFISGKNVFIFSSCKKRDKKERRKKRKKFPHFKYFWNFFPPNFIIFDKISFFSHFSDCLMIFSSVINFNLLQNLHESHLFSSIPSP